MRKSSSCGKHAAPRIFSVPPTAVVEVLDYQSQVRKNVINGKSSPIDLPASNVIQLLTEAGDKVTARPSGTEPKIKFYFSVKTNLDSKEEYQDKKTVLQEKIKTIQKEMQLV